MSNKHLDFLIYICLAVLLYMPIFGYMEVLPIRLWDESRVAVNAYEMYKTGDPIVTYYEGAPEMWNTKPPLLLWIQASLMKVIRVNEYAVRLPSAIAALFTCIVLLIFSRRYLKESLIGVTAILVLITANGYIGLHAVRTGDYDALLTLFTTLSGLLFFAFCETQKNKYLYLMFLFLALGVLTKSVSGLLFLPAFFLYGLLRKQIFPLLKNKHFYIGVAGFLVLVLGYYVLRETYNPGYIKQVQLNELGGRYLETLEEHSHGFWFYFENLYSRFGRWIIFALIGIFVGGLVKNKKVKRLAYFSFLMAITYLLVISSSQTKLIWYDVPAYPFLAILAAITIWAIIKYLRKLTQMETGLKAAVITSVILILLFIIPYRGILEKTFRPQETGGDIEFYEISYYIRDAVNGKRDLNNRFLSYEGDNAHLLFYLNVLRDRGQSTSLKYWTELAGGDVVFAQQGSVKQDIEEIYEYEITETEGNVVTYKINGRKE